MQNAPKLDANLDDLQKIIALRDHLSAHPSACIRFHPRSKDSYEAVADVQGYSNCHASAVAISKALNESAVVHERVIVACEELIKELRAQIASDFAAAMGG